MSYYSEMLEVELKRNRQAQSVFQHNLDRIGNFSLYLVRRKGRTYVYKKEISNGKPRFTDCECMPARFPGCSR